MTFTSCHPHLKLPHFQSRATAQQLPPSTLASTTVTQLPATTSDYLVSCRWEADGERSCQLRLAACSGGRTAAFLASASKSSSQKKPLESMRGTIRSFSWSNSGHLQGRPGMFLLKRYLSQTAHENSTNQHDSLFKFNGN